MGLTAPKNGAYVGGLTSLQFDQLVSGLDVWINGVPFHSEECDAGPANVFTLDLNVVPPDTQLVFKISYRKADGTQANETLKTWKPRHDLAGMGATVIRQGNDINGVFFKFWLPKVRAVYIRGSFNHWKRSNRMDQLGDTGYWYCFSGNARAGDDYKFLVETFDQKIQEVSDPAARHTIKTRFNSADNRDANAVIVDAAAFNWRYDSNAAAERRDFRRLNIYQAHWGTFLRTGATNFRYETFVNQDPALTEQQKRDGVREKLQYVSDMGFTAIQLLPLHEANGDADAGYDPSYFFAVETAYGTPDELRLLVDEAHGLGLAVIFDSVVNHQTAELAHASFSQEFIKGYYIKADAPWSNEKQWGGDDWGPDPDFTRSEIRNFITDCMLMYAEEFHVDGIRFDSTSTIPRDALKEMIGRLRSDPRSRGIYLIAEQINDDPFPYIIGDVNMNASWYKPAFYSGMNNVLQIPVRGNLNELRKAMESDYNGNPSSAIKYILGSHDENWENHGGSSPAAKLGGAANFFAQSKVRLGWALTACSLGTPMMFMGCETLEDGAWRDYEGYRGRNWNPAPNTIGGQFKAMITAINSLRRTHAALRGKNTDNALVHWDDVNGVLAYKRWDSSGGVFLIVINISDGNWSDRDYQINTGTPDSEWRECFNSQYVNFGGWTGADNSDATFYPRADATGLLEGVNLAKWSLVIFKKNG